MLPLNLRHVCRSRVLGLPPWSVINNHSFPLLIFVKSSSKAFHSFKYLDSMKRLMLVHWNSRILKAASNEAFLAHLNFFRKKMNFFYDYMPFSTSRSLKWTLNELIDPSIRPCLHRTCIWHTLLWVTLKLI